MNADPSPARVEILGEADARVLDRVAPGVFDRDLDPVRTLDFLRDPRHHLAVAMVDGAVVGMASAVDYLHPDKPPELWIDEIGVAPAHRRRGLGRRLVECLLTRGRELGCGSAWVLTDMGNAPARELFRAGGGKEAEGHAVMIEFDLSP